MDYEDILKWLDIAKKLEEFNFRTEDTLIISSNLLGFDFEKINECFETGLE